jgi:outer membrane protein assembly factor BamE (lipoprotein component of BamABCDE complex)
MNRFITSFFIIVFLLSGCSTSGNQNLKNETPQSLQSKIIKNKTTKTELLTNLGEPDTRTTLDDGNEQWRYFMYNNQFNASTFIPVVGLLTGGSQTQSKTLEIDFNGETVSKWTFSLTITTPKLAFLINCFGQENENILNSHSYPYFSSNRM